MLVTATIQHKEEGDHNANPSTAQDQLSNNSAVVGAAAQHTATMYGNKRPVTALTPSLTGCLAAVVCQPCYTAIIAVTGDDGLHTCIYAADGISTFKV
jgi:hypothetical protein